MTATLMPSTSSLDDKSSIWTVDAGYRPWPYFAADVGFADLGTAKYRANVLTGGSNNLYKYSITSGGPTLAVMGIVPIGHRFEVYGRGGLLFARTSLKEHAENTIDVWNGSATFKSRDLFAGIGAAFNFTDTVAVNVRAYRFFDVGDKYRTGESDVDAFSVGVTFRQ